MIIDLKRKRRMTEFQKDCILALTLCFLFVACAAFDEYTRGQQIDVVKK